MRLVIMVGLLAACGTSAPNMASRDKVDLVLPATPAPKPSTTWPGCTATELATRTQELDTLRDHLWSKSAESGALLSELGSLLHRPCLAHVGPSLSLPEHASLLAIREAFSSMDYELRQAMTGIRLRGDRRLLYIPPEIIPELSKEARRAILPMMCTTGRSGCERAASYILRAEKAFDNAESHAKSRLLVPETPEGGILEVELPMRVCNGNPRREEARPTSFLAWASCVGARAPKNRRYAEKNLRPLAQGWLVLRGRRGHYQFQDEIRFYDLATGAAYVAQSTGGLIVTQEQAEDAARGPTSFTGKVAPDQLRELAFILLTREAIVPVRTAQTYARIPDELPLAIGPEGDYPEQSSWSRVTWVGSDQTEISFAVIDGAFRATGSFTWPNADNWVDNHITHLVRVLEAGLVPGCAPAKLPPSKALAIPQGKVSAIDASENSLNKIGTALDREIDALRSQACRGAR